ncbi:unnamed protein product [Caenorhabditis sp. 36 PRJEB53466]|nr:unnamed protein product [Caenorhabditis sp. 36 PRJEB53466]
MGACSSFIPNEEAQEKAIAIKRSREIELTLVKKKKAGVLEQSLLLLGPGESGKSTVFKQIRAMSGSYTKHELQEKKLQIMQNICAFTRILLDYARDNCLDFRPEDAELFERMYYKLRSFIEKGLDLKPDIVDGLKKFWDTKAIQQAYDKRYTFHLTDSAAYFFENLDRIKEPDYEPTNQDIVHIRMPTVGVVEADILLKNIKLSITDCGGQRSERKKWLKYFEDVQLVLFVAAISEYDQRLAEDNDTNRVEEALRLFWTLFSNKRYFQKSTIILFLNKNDIFKEKVKTVPIKKYFPKFEGENTYSAGVKFFRNQFKYGIDEQYRKKMYVHETCAISDQVQLILNTVIDSVVQDNLKDTGMI